MAFFVALIYPQNDQLYLLFFPLFLFWSPRQWLEKKCYFLTYLVEFTYVLCFVVDVVNVYEVNCFSNFGSTSKILAHTIKRLARGWKGARRWKPYYVFYSVKTT